MSGEEWLALAEFTTRELAEAAAGAIAERRMSSRVEERGEGKWAVLVPREWAAEAGEAIVVPRLPRASEEYLAACPECGYDLKGLGAATTCPECGYPLILHQRRAAGEGTGPPPLTPSQVRLAGRGALVAGAILAMPVLSLLLPARYGVLLYRAPALCVAVVGILVVTRAHRERKARRSR